MLGAIVGAAVGFVIGIFVYRNNSKKLGELAEKVDKVYNKVEEKVK